MSWPKIHLRWLALLISLVAISAGCKSALSPREYTGTIYYTDNKGVWKMTLPDRKTSLLTDKPGLPGLGLSPDQKWLLYYDSDSQDKDGRWLRSLWIVSTQGGEPAQVSHAVPLIWPGGWEKGWFRYTELSDFQLDPKLGYATPRRVEAFAFNPETKERRLESSSASAPLPPTDSPGSCRKLAFAPPKYDDVAEKCMDANGNGFLRVVKVDGSSPITIPVTYGDGALIWSGDGEWLAFGGSKNSQGLSQPFLWNRWSRSMKQIRAVDSQEEYSFDDPRWSPDSQWLAFLNWPDDLCVVKAQTGAPKCFKGYVSNYGTPPEWSPDSRGILISSNRIGRLLMGDSDLRSDLFIIRIPEGDVVRLTNDSNAEAWPIWVR